MTYTTATGGIAVLAGCSGDDTEAENADDENESGENGDDGNGGNESDEADDENENSEDEENLVVVAPDDDWRFDPEEITISVGETVTWYFEAPGHNVSSHPDASSQNENPDDAEPFASYEGDNHSELVDEGEEYEHTFETPGEYTYVCTPHDGSMIGTVIVEE
jgi:plastocyanin